MAARPSCDTNAPSQSIVSATVGRLGASASEHAHAKTRAATDAVGATLIRSRTMRLYMARFIAFVVCLTPTVAGAQAWVDDKGSLDVSFDYNLGISSKVVCSAECNPTPGADKEAFEDAGSTTHQFTLGADYVIISKLAASIQVPLAMLKYTGDETLYPHAGGGEYDDGDYHTTLTDLRAGVRYQVLEEPFALAPHLAFTIPMADYETIGNTVAGRHLKALHLGVSAGYIIGEASYIHAMYEFSLVEKYDRTDVTAEYGQNRSDFVLTLGTKLLDQRLDLNVGANGRITHGGLAFDEFDSAEPDALMYHDAILKEDIFLVGAGVGYQLSDTIGVTLGARLFVAGANTQNASVIGAGVQWTAL
jgi:hypothetical protein